MIQNICRGLENYNSFEDVVSYLTTYFPESDRTGELTQKYQKRKNNRVSSTISIDKSSIATNNNMNTFCFSRMFDESQKQMKKITMNKTKIQYLKGKRPTGNKTKTTSEIGATRNTCAKCASLNLHVETKLGTSKAQGIYKVYH